MPQLTARNEAEMMDRDAGVPAGNGGPSLGVTGQHKRNVASGPPSKTSERLQQAVVVLVLPQVGREEEIVTQVANPLDECRRHVRAAPRRGELRRGGHQEYMRAPGLVA